MGNKNLKTHATSYPFDFLFCVPQTEVEHPEVFTVDDKLQGTSSAVRRESFSHQTLQNNEILKKGNPYIRQVNEAKETR